MYSPLCYPSNMAKLTSRSPEVTRVSVFMPTSLHQQLKKNARKAETPLSRYISEILQSTAGPKRAKSTAS